MTYLASILALAILSFGFIFYNTKRKKQKSIDQLRETWGKPKNTPFYFNRIQRFAEIIKDERYHRLTNQTLYDIDFQELFMLLDRTSSRVGQQYLYKKLIEPTNNVEALKKSSTFSDLLSSDVALREEVQKELSYLNNPDAYYVASLLQSNVLKRPWWFSLLYVNLFAVAVLLLFSLQNPGLLILIMIPASLNMLSHYWNKENMFQYIKSFPQLNILIQVASKINTKGSVQYSPSVEKSLSTLDSFVNKTALLNLGNDGRIKDEITYILGYFVELVKSVLVIEVLTLFHLIKEIQVKKDHILTLFNFVGEIDLALSVASVRAGNLKTCVPNLTLTGKELITKDAYHPLIAKCAPNDLHIHDKGILITGSNMSGKSTFLRTIIINSILAQTIYTCFAEEYSSPVLKQFSSVRIDDDLLKGKSYYFEEVNIMSTLIEEVESPHQNLFILDEVFKGTNTIERISAAKAILSYLNQKDNIVIVSTHDLELPEMLKGEYDFYHFSESIEGKHLIFDHLIKPGKLKTRNAIKILELADYPRRIVDEALHLSKTIDNQRNQ